MRIDVTIFKVNRLKCSKIGPGISGELNVTGDETVQPVQMCMNECSKLKVKLL